MYIYIYIQICILSNTKQPRQKHTPFSDHFFGFLPGPHGDSEGKAPPCRRAIGSCGPAMGRVCSAVFRQKNMENHMIHMMYLYDFFFCDILCKQNVLELGTSTCLSNLQNRNGKPHAATPKKDMEKLETWKRALTFVWISRKIE